MYRAGRWRQNPQTAVRLLLLAIIATQSSVYFSKAMPAHLAAVSHNVFGGDAV
jgi:hypothetical protein